MRPDVTESPARSRLDERPRVVLPCAESCTAFRRLPPGPWADFGVCTNPRSPYCGYPVRPGRDCRHFLTSVARDINPAN